MKKIFVIVGCLVAVAAISHITMSLAQWSREQPVTTQRNTDR